MATQAQGTTVQDKLKSVLLNYLATNSQLIATLGPALLAIISAAVQSLSATATTLSQPTVTYVEKEKIVGAPWALFITVACRNFWTGGSSIILCDAFVLQTCDVSSTCGTRVAFGLSVQYGCVPAGPM